jgi:hypothetical protein
MATEIVRTVWIISLVIVQALKFHKMATFVQKLNSSSDALSILITQ